MARSHEVPSDIPATSVRSVAYVDGATHVSQIRERTRPKEVPELILDAPSLRISGKLGGGKTTIANGLSRILRIPTFNIGETDRAQTNTNLGFRPRDHTYDLDLDAQQIEALENATRSRQMIVEGHLATVFGRMVDAKRRPHNRGVSLHVHVQPKVGAERIRKRQNERQKRKDANAPDLTLEEVLEQTRDRMISNWLKWRRLYPEDIGNDVDPLEKGATNPQGEPFADCYIDTSYATTEQQSVALALKVLMDMGAIVRNKEYKGQRHTIEQIVADVMPPVEVFSRPSHAHSRTQAA